MTTCAIYTRYSPGEDREKTSTTANQVAMCREYAERKGWEVLEPHIYTDELISGGSDERPAFQSMLEAIEKGSFPNILVCKDTSRFARNELQAGIHKDWIRRRGIEIRFVLQDFGEGDEAWFTERQMDLIAELFRRKKSKEVYEHQRQNALAGYSNGGIAPFGYQRKVLNVGGKRKVVWELHPEEAPIVRQVFDWHLSGHGSKQIRTWLNEQGKRDRKGKPFSHALILEWFRNPFKYAGFRCWNVRDENMRRNPRSKWVMVPDAHPAIITEEEAEKVYDAMMQRRQRERIEGERKYLLTGLLVCAECGARFGGHSYRTRDAVYYRCSSRNRRGNAACSNRSHLMADPLEREVVERVFADLTDPQVFSDWVAATLRLQRERAEEQASRLERLSADLEQTEIRIRRLVDALAEGEIPVSAVREKLRELEDEKRHLERAIAGASVQVVDLRVSETELAEYAEVLREAAGKDKDLCRRVLETVVKQVTVQADGTCTVEYDERVCYPLSGSATALPHGGSNVVSPRRVLARLDGRSGHGYFSSSL